MQYAYVCVYPVFSDSDKLISYVDHRAFMNRQGITMGSFDSIKGAVGRSWTFQIHHVSCTAGVCAYILPSLRNLPYVSTAGGDQS